MYEIENLEIENFEIKNFEIKNFEIKNFEIKSFLTKESSSQKLNFSSSSEKNSLNDCEGFSTSLSSMEFSIELDFGAVIISLTYHR